MANKIRISELDELTTPTTGDLIPIVDVSDTTENPTGTVKAVGYTTLKDELAVDVQGAIDHAELANLNSTNYSHLTSTQKTDLTDSGDSTLHYHTSDRARSNHTGTQVASTISDFDTEVSNNTDVSANTSARHSAATVSGAYDYITLSGQDIVRGQVDLTTDVSGVLPNANVANDITLDNITQITTRSHTSLSDVGTNTHTQIDSHISNTSNPHSVTKSQVGLGSVTNDAQVPLSYLDTDGTLATNSDLKVSTQKAVKTYVDNATPSTEGIQDIVGGMVSGNTETGIVVTYDDTNGKLDFVVSGVGVSDGDKGDITVSSSGSTWTVDNDAITYAKIQNASASGVALGRVSAGAGDLEEILIDSDLTSVSTSHDTLASAKSIKTYVDNSVKNPGGSNTYVQYNNGGNFGGDADMTYNSTSNILTVPNINTSLVSNPSGNIEFGDSSTGGNVNVYTGGILKSINLQAGERGAVSVLAGEGSASTAGATVDIRGGDGGSSSGNGGRVDIYGGDAISGQGGHINAYAGDGTTTVGYVALWGGNNTAANGNGGDIWLIPGKKAGSGVDGKIYLESATTAYDAVLDMSGLTASRDFVWPNVSGTIAVRGDIPYNFNATVFNYTTDITTGDGKYYFVVPSTLNGKVLSRVFARVITAGTTGTTDIQIANVTDSVDMLSTKLTIDSGETGSDTAATPAVINTSNDDVATNDLLRIDIDAVSTTAPKGLIIVLEFS